MTRHVLARALPRPAAVASARIGHARPLLRVGRRSIFGGPDEMEVSRAVARRRRFDSLLLALGPPPQPVRAAVERAVEAALVQHATQGTLASPSALSAAVDDALPALTALQTAPLARSVSVAEMASAAAEVAPAAAKAAVAAEHQTAMAEAAAQTAGPATPAAVLGGGSAPVAQHNAAVHAAAAGGAAPLGGDGQAVEAAQDQPLPAEDLSEEELLTVHAMRMAAALTVVRDWPWEALVARAATNGGGSGGGGVPVALLLDVSLDLGSGDTSRALQTDLLLSRASLPAGAAAPSAPPSAVELEAASRTVAAVAVPLLRGLLERSTLHTEAEAAHLASLGGRTGLAGLLQRGPPPPSGAAAAAAVLVTEMTQRSLPRRLAAGLLARLRSSPPAPPEMLAAASAAVNDPKAVHAALQAEAVATPRLAPLYGALSSEPTLLHALAGSFYNQHDRAAGRRRRRVAFAKLLGLFMAGNVLDFVLSNI